MVGLYAVVLVGTAVAGPGLDLGAAGGAGRPVPAARRLLGARLGVPDRRRSLPVEPPPARARLRLVQRLGGALRLRGGEHDDRLPGRALAADPARDRPRAPTRSSLAGMGLVLVAGGDRVARNRPRRQGGAGRDPGRDPRLGRDRADPAARLPQPGHLDPRRHARRRGALGRLGLRRDAGRARGRRLGLHRLRLRRRRRRGDPRRRPPRARGRSGSPCSASACW